MECPHDMKKIEKKNSKSYLKETYLKVQPKQSLLHLFPIITVYVFAICIVKSTK